MPRERFAWKNKVIIRIEGPEVVRFLNICAFHRIAFYRIREEGGGLCCTVSPDHFREIYRLRHKASVSVRVLSKRGVYFWHRKNRERRPAYFFAAAAFAALYIMSLFIWDISFEGNVRYTDSYLLRFVQEEGYRPGMKINSVSCSALEKAIRNEFDDITWVSAMIDGTRLVIRIKENTQAAEAGQEMEPADLFADQDGVIMRMVTRSGTPQVSVGDEVHKGDLLVSGKVPVKNDAGETDHYLYQAASADVWIRYDSWFEYRVRRTQKVRVYQTTRTRNALWLFGNRISFPFGDQEPYEELYMEQTPVRIFDNFYLPVRLETLTVRKYTEREEKRTDEELTEQVNAHFLDFLTDLEKIGVEIIQNNVTIEIREDFCLMKGTLTLERNAVYTQPLSEEAVPAENKQAGGQAESQ